MCMLLSSREAKLGCISIHIFQYPQIAKFFFFLFVFLITVCSAGGHFSETDSELRTDTGMNPKHEHTKYFHALDHMVSFEITQFCSQGGNSHRQDTSKWPWLCSKKSPSEHSSMNQTWLVACGLPTPSIKLYGPKGTFIPAALWLRTN